MKTIKHKICYLYFYNHSTLYALFKWDWLFKDKEWSTKYYTEN